MIRFVAGPIFMLLAVSMAMAQDQDPVFSGPQKGERMTPFKVWVSTGPDTGKEVTLMPKDQKGSSMIIFVHEVTRPAFQLMKPLDKYAAMLKRKGLETYFVWLTKDKNETEAFFNRANKSLNFESPLTVSLDGLEGPGNYGLNRKVSLTILIGKDGKVTDNFAIIQPNETDAPKILDAMAKVTGEPKAPPLASLRKDGRMPAKDQPAPELGTIMRRMIQKSNSEADVKKIAEELRNWAGDNRARRQELRALAGRVVQAGYGTEAAQAELKKLAGID